MAATNRPDVLDPALLRPGRFDRQITVNRPDAQGREDILKVHSRNKPLGPDVDLKEVAKDTIGFTGADLENLLNEAALLAVRRKKKALTMAEINDASSRVQMGTEKKSHKYSKKAKRLTAYHEAGHAVAAYYVEGHDPVKEISIIPRGLGAGGYTWYTPQEENYNSKKEMLDDLISMLGGRVAEALALGDISTGASNDLQRATQICRDMVAKYGMSEVLGPAVFSDENDEVFLGKDFGHVNNYSEATSAKIDAEIERMMQPRLQSDGRDLKDPLREAGAGGGDPAAKREAYRRDVCPADGKRQAGRTGSPTHRRTGSPCGRNTDCCGHSPGACAGGRRRTGSGSGKCPGRPCTGSAQIRPITPRKDSYLPVAVFFHFLTFPQDIV